MRLMTNKIYNKFINENKAYKNMLKVQQENLDKEIDILENKIEEKYSYIKLELIHKKTKEDFKNGLNKILTYISKGRCLK